MSMRNTAMRISWKFTLSTPSAQSIDPKMIVQTSQLAEHAEHTAAWLSHGAANQRTSTSLSHAHPAARAEDSKLSKISNLTTAFRWIANYSTFMTLDQRYHAAGQHGRTVTCMLILFLAHHHSS